MSIQVLRWHPLPNATGIMLGFLDLELPSGIVINAAKLMRGPNGTHWIAMPSVRRLDKEGRPVLGEEGKPLFDQIVGFRDHEVRDRFRDQALEAIRRAYPEALGGLL